MLTALFGLFASWLFGGLLALGATLASVFLALIWFGYTFQALLYGAAYARLRATSSATRWTARDVSGGQVWGRPQRRQKRA